MTLHKHDNNDADYEDHKGAADSSSNRGSSHLDTLNATESMTTSSILPVTSTSESVLNLNTGSAIKSEEEEATNESDIANGDENVTGNEKSSDYTGPYRLYPWRYVGLFAMAMLNIAGGMQGTWLGPIATAASSQFSISLSQINWLQNIVQFMFVPVSLIAPYISRRIGMHNTCYLGSAILVLGVWLRYAAIPHPNGGSARAYAPLMIGQIIVGAAQPIFLTIGPKYSELWFDLDGRVTATMVISVCNPLGGAIAQLITPAASSPRSAILITALVSTALASCAVLVRSKPPTPPTYAGSQPSLSPLVTLRAVLCRERPDDPKTMDTKDKIDFLILIYGFGVHVAADLMFGLFTNQILSPYGYSEKLAGLMGAVLLLAGLVAAVITAPLFDRVFTNHLALSCKIMLPVLSCSWFSLVWAVRANNTAALFVICSLIGVVSISLLPVTLELSAELTKNTETSAAVLWSAGHILTFIFVIVENALRAGPDANPPHNMRRALIFNGAFALSASAITPFVKGKQSRRKLDEDMNEKSRDLVLGGLGKVVKGGVKRKSINHDEERGVGNTHAS